MDFATIGEEESRQGPPLGKRPPAWKLEPELREIGGPGCITQPSRSQGPD